MMNYPSRVHFISFVYEVDANNLSVPLAMAVEELTTGASQSYWLGGNPPVKCPIDMGGSLLVSYGIPPVMSCFRVLGWGLPACVLDLHAEDCASKAGGMKRPTNLLQALADHGLSGVAAGGEMGRLESSLHKGVCPELQRKGILDRCQADVHAVGRLMKAMWSGIDFGAALLRGEYGKAVAQIESVGIPLDVARVEELNRYWPELKPLLIREVDTLYGVYEKGTFKVARFEQWLAKKGVPWPRLGSGSLDLKRETFKQVSATYPIVRPLHELRKTLDQIRTSDIPVCEDGRNRFQLRPFSSKTGRNQPKGSEFIFSFPKWMRHLVKAPRGYSLAYLDWSGQEFGIAAALSGDARMKEAYATGDPHMAFAKFARIVPEDATAATHPDKRSACKIANLGILMGMSVSGLTQGLGGCRGRAQKLLHDHKEVFPDYWRWSEDNVNHHLLGNTLYTEMGWPLHHSPGTKTTTARNFKLQANGAEMMRLAAIAITAKGHMVCAPVHDAFLILAESSKIEEEAASVAEFMADASRVILRGFALRTDIAYSSHAGGYGGQEGVEMWGTVQRLIAGLKKGQHEEGAKA